MLFQHCLWQHLSIFLFTSASISTLLKKRQIEMSHICLRLQVRSFFHLFFHLPPLGLPPPQALRRLPTPRGPHPSPRELKTIVSLLSNLLCVKRMSINKHCAHYYHVGIYLLLKDNKLIWELLKEEPHRTQAVFSLCLLDNRLIMWGPTPDPNRRSLDL